MKKTTIIGIGIVFLLIIIAAGLLVGKEIFQKNEVKINSSEENKIVNEEIPSQRLTGLCSNEEECKAFCSNNRGECEEYCKGNENALCQIIFPPDGEKKESEKNDVEKDDRPVLKNMGITIEPWNKQTNLAGDLIFSKKLLFDDGRVSNDKVFIDFGHKEKYRPDDIGSIEYWFYVPLKTKVRAPIDGTVEVAFFNHTKDWGVNIRTDNSEWIVSFEHLVNLIVKEGDTIKAGDIVGEATPRTTFKNEIAMVELAVWTGGKGIVKYCPFNYLDESLKPVYKEKFEKVANDWETFIGRDVYQQEKWVAPGCLVENIIEVQ